MNIYSYNFLKHQALKRLFSLSFLVGVLLYSCSDPSSQRIRPSDVTGVNGLESGEFTTFKQKLEVLSEEMILPADQAQFNRILTFKNTQKTEFTISFEKSNYRCVYHYDQATQETTYSHNVTKNTQGAESILYQAQTTLIPIDPIYASVPQVEEIKQACQEHISLLNITEPIVDIDIIAQLQEFKTLIQEQLIDLIDICGRGARTTSGRRCIGANFTRSLYTEDNPVDTFAFTIEFTWQLDSGAQETSVHEMELAPGLFYLDTLGFINLTGPLPLASGAVDLPFKAVNTTKLSGF